MFIVFFIITNTKHQCKNLSADTLNSSIDKLTFDSWREIKYYEYIRDQVIKKHICPNFISIMLYKKDTNSNINFSKLRIVKRQSNSVYAKKRDELYRKQINDLHSFNTNDLTVALKTKNQSGPLRNIRGVIDLFYHVLLLWLLHFYLWASATKFYLHNLLIVALSFKNKILIIFIRKEIKSVSAILII